MMRHFCSRQSKVFLLFVLTLLVSQCATQPAKKSELPTEIRGIRLEMTKDEAHQRLNEIAGGMQEAKKNQEIWLLKDDPNFSHIMIGYDKENKVRFITTTLEKKWESQKQRLKFSEIGDLSTARKESVENVNKYFWDVEAAGKNPAYQVYVYGDNSEHLLHFSIAKRMIEKKEEEDEK